MQSTTVTMASSSEDSKTESLRLEEQQPQLAHPRDQLSKFKFAALVVMNILTSYVSGQFFPYPNGTHLYTAGFWSRWTVQPSNIITVFQDTMSAIWPTSKHPCIRRLATSTSSHGWQFHTRWPTLRRFPLLEKPRHSLTSDPFSSYP